ncbi:hypothetical protein Mal52_41330 [Symmachiella dynata]|uniref:Uncharacterized protein n=1 Tax=Symmachiella dynata TaxID=2527995 RepID=A0A517ZT21_9PLAN|nr:hypothetical protein [Symmachiella dynata]QDU45638.1 hypothetical protein Mal52_41330 [Symmachiella dynata]
MASEQNPQFQTLRLWYFGVVVVLIIAVLIVAPWAAGVPPSGYIAEADLPDGSILSLRAVTYGKHHELPLESLDNSLLPSFGFRKTPDSLQRETGANSIVLWFSRRNRETGEAMGFDWWQRCSAVDVNGWVVKDFVPHQEFFSDRFWDGSNSGGQWGGDRPLQSISTGEYDIVVASSMLPSFRTAGTSFTLQVHNTTGKVVAEFEVPSPGVAKNSTWVPKALPITKSTGDLSVSLKDLKLELPHQPKGYALNAFADVSMPSDDRSAQWRLENVHLEDELGNVSDVYDCILSPLEPAWKVVARLARREDAPPLPIETWNAGSIPLPADGKVKSLHLSGSVGGASIGVESIGGAGQVTYKELGANLGRQRHFHDSGVWVNEKNVRIEVELATDGNQHLRTIKSDIPHLVLKLPLLTRLQELRILGLDNLNQQIPGKVTEEEGKTYWFFEPSPGSTSIDVKFIITNKREVEFIVAPPAIAKPN